MDLDTIGFLNDRLEEITANMRKTNGEYAVAVKMRSRLYEEIKPIINSQEDLELCTSDFLNFQKYFQYDFTITAIEQQTFYRQGYMDCVDLLKKFGVLL